jgi:transcriptional regulator with XRE-family HTH domain
VKTYTYDEIHAELMADPTFREAWEQEAFARAVSIEVLRYRIEREMTQEQLAAHLGTSLDVAELEDGEETPDLETLVLLSEHLGLKFAITIDPPESTTARAAQPSSVRARIAGAVVAA